MLRRNLQCLLFFACVSAHADDVVLPPDQFVREAFGGVAPAMQSVWIDDAMQSKLEPIFGHRYPAARVRYWHAGARTAWILEDIGKEFPITAGFIVKDDEIEAARLLIYRESRGGEIGYPGFLRQFSGAKLSGEDLAGRIDGISGATLSVDAMRRMARAALVLSKTVH